MRRVIGSALAFGGLAAGLLGAACGSGQDDRQRPRAEAGGSLGSGGAPTAGGGGTLPTGLGGAAGSSGISSASGGNDGTESGGSTNGAGGNDGAGSGGADFGGAGGSDVSGAGGADSGGAAGYPIAPPTFASVRSIMSTSCAFTGCHHQGGGTKQVDLRDNAGLYARLMGQAPSTADAACRNRTLVVPGKPDMSLIVAMIEAPAAPRMMCGEQMPKGCKDNCLLDEEIATFVNWIAMGAPQN
jgi:hypothetical protein